MKKNVFVDTFIVFALAIIAGVLFQRAQPYGLAFNTSPSIPRGLYLTKDTTAGEVLERGQLVCWKYAPTGWLAERRYTPPGIRVCKPIGALPGDAIFVDDHVLSIEPSGGVKEQVARVAQTDSKGLPLPNALAGVTTVQPGTLVVIAREHIAALDSRYIGPLPRMAIEKTLTPIWNY